MNTIVEHINSAGFSFIEFAVPMLVQSGVLIVILLLADLLLRKKVKALFRYWIWMLVLLKLILPPSLSSPLSLGYLFGDKLTYQDLVETTSALEPTEPAPAETLPGINPLYIQPNLYVPPKVPMTSVVEPTIIEPVGPPVAQVTPLSWQGIVFLVWLAVVIAMGLLLLQRAFFVRGLVLQAKEAPGLMNDALEYCRESMKVKCRVGLKVSPNAAAPSVCGLIRPVILVPSNLASTLGASRLRTVLMHELAHIRRADLWVNLAQTVLQIIYSYNPMLWIANCVIRRVREQAVDEMVLVAMGEKAQRYPQTLVSVAKLTFKRPALSLRLIGVVESESALAGRIKHILNRPIPKTAKLGILSIVAVIVAAFILLPMAKARGDKKEAQPKMGFVATLPNGVAVELVGICEHPSEGKQWWRPDGTLWEDRPYEEFSSYHSMSGEKGYELVWRLSSDEDVVYDVESADQKGSAGRDVLHNERGLRSALKNGEFYGAILFFSPRLSQAAIGIGVGLDKNWKTIASLEGDLSKAASSINNVHLYPAIEADGRTYIDAAYRFPEGEGQAYRLVAVDTSNRQHIMQQGSETKGRESVHCRKQIDLPLKQIKTIYFQTLPLQWVTFENVSLRPGVKTDVRIVTEKPVDGGWEDVGEAIPADFNDTIVLTEQITLGSTGQDVEGKTFITFVWDKEKERNRQYRFVLINKEDVVLEPDGHIILDEDSKLVEKFTFNEPYVSWRLKGVKLQSRPLPPEGTQGIWSQLQKDTSAAFEGKRISPSKLSPPGRYAIELDGVDDYLFVQDSPTLRLKPPFTVEMWIKPNLPEQKPDRVQEWGVIAQGCYIGTGQVKTRGFGIELTRFEKEPANFLISYCEANDRGITGKDYGPYHFDDWVHISHVFEGENYKPGYGHPLVVGKFLIPTAAPFLGQIGEIRIWNTARTDQEIRRFKDVALTGKEPGLAACWTFEQGQGQFVYDISGNNNHARLGKSIEVDDADPKWVDLKPAPHKPGQKTGVQVEVLTDKPAIALDLDSGKLMRLDRDWPDEYDVGWDNDAGGALFTKPDGPVKMLPIIEAKNFADALSVAPQKIESLKVRGVHGVPAQQSRYILVKTSQNNIAVLEVEEFDENKAKIKWQIIQRVIERTDVQVEDQEIRGQAVIGAVNNKAALASGETVELLGVTHIPATEDLWWRPDGSPLPQVPFGDVSFTPSVDPNWEQFSYYAIAIKVTGRPAQQIGLIKWDFTDAIYAGTTSAYADDRHVYYENIHAGATKFPKAIEKTTLRLGIVSGDWKTIFAGRHYGFYEKGKDTAHVSTPERAGGPFSVHPGEKGLHIEVTYNITDRDFRVVAVDKGGKVHLSSRTGSGGTQNLRRTTASFPELTHDQLKEFRFQVRGWEWVEFKDISLRPDKEAVALAEQRKTKRQEEIEKWLGQGQTRQIRQQILILRQSRLDHINEPCMEQTEAISAMRELARIGEPALPELVTELRQAEHWLEKSLIAFVLRAIGDPQAVPELIEELGRAKYRGEYGIYVKDDELAKFMLDNQHCPPDESDRKSKAIRLGCPVIEITAALEKITGHSEGHEHYGHKATAELGRDAPHDKWQQRVQEIVREVADRWQNWWNQHKTDMQVESEPVDTDNPRDAVSAIVEQLKSVKHVHSGRGSADVVDVHTNSSYQSSTRTERILDFRFEGDLSRSDAFTSERGERGDFECGWAIGPMSSVRYNKAYGSVTVQARPFGQFYRKLGYDFHPETFPRMYQNSIVELLEALVKQPQVTLKVTQEPKDILRIVSEHKDETSEEKLIMLLINGADGMRLSSWEYTARDSTEGSTGARRSSLRLKWKKYAGLWYISEAISEGAGVHDGLRTEGRTTVTIREFIPNVEIEDEEFTLDGLDIPPGAMVNDRILDTRYRYAGSKGDAADMLRKLSRATQMYANDYDNKFPDSMQQLKQFLDEEELRWLSENVCYLGKGKTVLDLPDIPLAYDRTMYEAEQEEGTNVLFVSGIVSFRVREQLKKLGITAGPKTDVPVEVEQGDESSESKNTDHYDKIPSDSVVVRVVDTKGRIIPIKDVPYTRIYYRDATTGNPIGWQIDLQIEKALSDGSLLVNHRDVLVRKFLAMNRETKRNDYTISMCFQPEEGPVFSATMLYPQKATETLSFVVPPRTKVAGVGNVAPDELAGRVVDVDGNPIAGAIISVYPDRGLENHPFNTDSKGDFRIPGFGDRWCLYVKVEKNGYATQWLTDFEIGKNFIVTMDQSTVLQGVFVNDSGERAGRTHITLAKYKLTMQPRRSNSVGPITITHETDDKGSYDFPVEPGLYDVKVASESGLFNRSRVFIGAGQIVSLPSTLKPGIRFQVKVVDSLTNKPIEDVNLWIDSHTTGRVDMKEGSQRTTNSEGLAVWESLMPGNTSFSIMKKGYCRWWSDACLRGFGTFKSVSYPGGYNWQRNIDSLRFDLIADMPVVVIKMEKGVKFSGRVLSPEGKPIAKAWVDITPADGPHTLTGDSRYQMITDENGCFGIEEKYWRGYVPAGKQVLYNLCAHDPEGRWVNAVSKPFASKPADEFEFALKMTKGGSVSGRVIDSEGNPVPDIEVEAIAKDNLDSPYFKPRALTDENGTFTLGPMREGKYWIQPDTMKGVNIARSPKQEKTEVKVVDGKVASAGDLLFRTGGPNR
jgi:beta-lactamase regulating signal transducer with metallopeptidase domain